MLSENQVRRILAQCERVDQSYGDNIPSGLQAEWAINKGWTDCPRYIYDTLDYDVLDSYLSTLEEV